MTVVQQFAERSVERFLTPEERQTLERVLATAEKTKAGRRGYINREAIAAIRLLVLTGMRRDEVRDLRWEQVDWRRSVLRLPDTKTGKRFLAPRGPAPPTGGSGPAYSRGEPRDRVFITLVAGGSAR